MEEVALENIAPIRFLMVLGERLQFQLPGLRRAAGLESIVFAVAPDIEAQRLRYYLLQRNQVLTTQGQNVERGLL